MISIEFRIEESVLKGVGIKCLFVLYGVLTRCTKKVRNVEHNFRCHNGLQLLFGTFLDINEKYVVPGFCCRHREPLFTARFYLQCIGADRRRYFALILFVK